MSQHGDYNAKIEPKTFRNPAMDNYNAELRKGSRFQHNKKLKMSLKKK